MLNYKHAYRIFCLLILFIASGCGASRHIKPEVKEKINSIEARIVFVNPDIYIPSDSGGGVGHSFGLVGLAVNIGSAISEGNENLIEAEAIYPLVRTLQPYNVPKKAKAIYQTALNNISWMKVKTWVIEKNEVSEHFSTTKASKYDAVLFIEVNYYLSDNFKRLSVDTKANMYKNRGELKNPEKVFTMTDNYMYDLSKHTDGLYDKHKLGKKWSENKAKLILSKITEGLKAQAGYMLKQLDPHSVYVPKDEVKEMNEPLEGAFEGK